MPRIDFCFSGWVRECHVTEAISLDGKKIDISQQTAEEVVANLSAGNYSISLADNLHEGKSEEISIFDYEAS